MKPHCEQAVLNILPAIRSLLARELLKTYGLTQQQAAKKLGTSQAAISQYMKQVRAYKVNTFEKNEPIMIEIKKLAETISKQDNYSLKDNLCDVCRLVRKNNLI